MIMLDIWPVAVTDVVTCSFAFASQLDEILHSLKNDRGNFSILRRVDHRSDDEYSSGQPDATPPFHANDAILAFQ